MTIGSSLALWGGLECTVARIGDRYRNQSSETGHTTRTDDLDRIAGLGIRTLRYPVIWETISPDRPDTCDWRWHDDRLAHMRRLGIAPIAGLIHHGSGPRYTDLLDPAFPALFAQHAANVAQRYPWISAYTPVNEPLTTARFSGLYGHWYPHQTNYSAFLRALVGQCLATVGAMRAVRRVNPAAQLVQTDDLGRTFSTSTLADQAEHENERRWLTFDLLCGRVDRHHPWWAILQDHGIGERDLATFLDGDCAPDIIGINHYLTSDRFLDGRVARYPDQFRGGNGVVDYSDVEAVRIANPGGALGPAARLAETWDRYGLPIAITEAHHGCTRDEQLRWLSEVWKAAQTVRAAGADIRAVTIWSMFGAVDWNSLLTREDGIYEPGVFDIRGPAPRPTALAHAASALAHEGAFDHPVLDGPAWWGREERFYRPVKARRREAGGQARSLLILGAGTPIGDAFSRIATIRGLQHELVGLDMVADEAGLDEVFGRGKPWAVIDTQVDAPVGLVSRCSKQDVQYLAVSTAEVFEARVGRAFDEDDQPDATSGEGRRVAEAESRLAQICPAALIVRAGPLFGPWDEDSFAARLLQAPASGDGQEGRVETVSPSYLPDLVHVALDLLVDRESGIWHLPNAGQATWAELAAMLADRTGQLPPGEAAAAGPNTPTTALESRRGMLLPPLSSALDRFVRECAYEWTPASRIDRLAAE